MKNVVLKPGEQLHVQCMIDGQVAWAAKDVLKLYSDLQSDCLNHSSDCNTQNRERIKSGCDCPFGKFNAAIFKLRDVLKEKGAL